MQLQFVKKTFSYYTSAKSHYPRVKYDFKYSTLPKMPPPFAALLTKPQVQQMRDWRMKYVKVLHTKDRVNAGETRVLKM